MGPGRRGLTPEDLRLWEEVAATATPLHPIPPPAPDRGTEPPPATRQPPPRRRPDPPRAAPAAVPPAGGPLMDRRRYERLRRGRLEPEARLDLHGMTSEHAHAVLTRFLLDAWSGDLRLVLVITGKGRPDDAVFRSHGILRHSLPHWLAAPPLVGLVLNVVPAHHRHGGAGAAYVYLRRRRTPA